MNSLTRLKGVALKPLWSESAVYKARRRCRTLVTTPFAALAGLAWGVYGAPVIGTGSQLMWGLLGAFSFPFLMYLEQRLVPPLTELAHRLGIARSNLSAAALEAGLVGVLVYLVTSVFGAPTVPAVGTALGIGAFYAFAMEYVLCGSAASDVVGLIRGVGVGAPARADRLSHADALLRRGDHLGAIAAYEEALARAPLDAGTYVRLAKAYVESGDHEDALQTLRVGFRKARLGPDEEAFVVRQIHEVCVRRLGTPNEALDDLRLLLSRQPAGQHAEWAEREIGDIEDGLYDES